MSDASLFPIPFFHCFLLRCAALRCVALRVQILLKLVTVEEAYQMIDWKLLVLIGSSIGIGKAMELSGLGKEVRVRRLGCPCRCCRCCRGCVRERVLLFVAFSSCAVRSL